MKTVLGVVIVLTMLLVLVSPVSARTCGKLRHRHSNVTHTHYSCVGDGHKHGRSIWQKHRDKLTTAGGAGLGDCWRNCWWGKRCGNWGCGGRWWRRRLHLRYSQAQAQRSL